MNYLIVPIISAILFCLAKLLEMKYTDERETFALKYVVRDTIIIFAVTLVAIFIDSNIKLHFHTLLNLMTETKTLPLIGMTEIFTDQPNF
jgi:Na+-transporting methylmalonyl-CoA/oxaloacetate decarboxylase beta subunit